MTDQSRSLVPLHAGAAVAAIVPTTIDEVWRIATLITRSGMAPYGIDSPEKASVIIMHGAEVGLSPMVALQSIAVINGKPALYGDGLLAVVRRSGLLDRITEATHEGGTDGEFARCTVTRGGQRVTRDFSKKQAIVAGLWGKRGRSGDPTPWVTYPSRMLQMRARAFALRDVFPDVLKGLASREEMEDVANGAGAVAASPAPPPPPPPSEPVPTPIEEAIQKRARKGGKAIIDAVEAKAEPTPIEPPAPPVEVVENVEELVEGAGADPQDMIVWDQDSERPMLPEERS